MFGSRLTPACPGESCRKHLGKEDTKQPMGKEDTKQPMGKHTTLLHLIRHWKRLRSIIFYHPSKHTIMEGADDIYESRWASKLVQYRPTSTLLCLHFTLKFITNDTQSDLKWGKETISNEIAQTYNDFYVVANSSLKLQKHVHTTCITGRKCLDVYRIYLFIY